MNYKKVVKELRGINIEWENGNIFPVYYNISGSFASQKRINKLKKIAILVIDSERKKIENEFKLMAKKRNNIIKIDFDYNTAFSRINNTKLSPESDNKHGESDYETIWISKNKISDAELLGVMIHEALHYFATFNGQDICEKDEHYIMRMLGDDC